jgi:drug/metabolite transporter (DMT)-like permease
VGSSGLRAKTFAMILFMGVFGPLGDVMLRMGMKRVGAVTSWSWPVLESFFLRTFTSGLVWSAIGVLLLFFISYVTVLSWADYSFVQPASALGYAAVALLGILLLGEAVSLTRWAGLAVICVGVILVGQTPPRTTEAN